MNKPNLVHYFLEAVYVWALWILVQRETKPPLKPSLAYRPVSAWGYEFALITKFPGLLGFRFTKLRYWHGGDPGMVDRVNSLGFLPALDMV